ncbi:MAG TPA: NAD-dependent epimerase/dehydratase family protein, partial [Gemmatimonadales bacterium]|nr:NAD-dependent epimerase/dehydratase family protein [Gemmatimonadales bacterium]
GEVADLDRLQSAFRGAQVVVHLAGRAHVRRDGAPDPLAAYRAANVELTRRSLQAARDAGAFLFLLASSAKAIGERSVAPWSEQTPPKPQDSYGLSKLEAERAVAEEGRQLGMGTIALRFPLIYGPGMRANMLRLFDALARGVPLPLGAIHNQRSLLYVGNACAAIEAAIRSGPGQSGLYHVSDGQDLSTPELVRSVAAALGRRARLFPVPVSLFQLAGRIGDALSRWWDVPMTTAAVERLTGSLQLDISLIRSRLGYTPPFSVAQGLEATAAWYWRRNQEVA